MGVEFKKWLLFQEEVKKNGRQDPTPLLSPCSLNRSHESHYPWTHREDQVNFHFLDFLSVFLKTHFFVFKPFKDCWVFDNAAN